MKIHQKKPHCTIEHIQIQHHCTNVPRNTSKTNIEREQKNADYINQQFKSHLEQQSEQLVTYGSLIDYYKNTALPNANLIIKNATKGYQNGDISYVEYVQSIETASQIQLNYNEAIYNYNQTIITIQYSINQ